MDSVDQAKSQAWSLWAKLAAPALLRCPVLGISAVLVVSTPLAAMARTLPRSQEFTSAEPTQRQLHVLHSYERYLARMRTQSIKAGRAVRFAYRQVGKPYQWGGAGPRTYDCSGLVMAAWRKGGLRLPHRADLQHRTIRRKVGLKSLRPGDLVFFSGDHHVGIYVGRRHFLHAPHTGARVQRGTLSGWRLRVFAGAARPGAPAYHPWPHWVRALAGQAEQHARPHHHHHHAVAPDITRPAGPVPPEFENGDPDSDVYPEQPPVETPPAAGPEQLPAADAGPAPLVTMSAHKRWHHVVPVGDTPVPPPAGEGAGRPRPHWPRSSVQKQNDEQQYNRDFDGNSDDDGDADDNGAGNDGIDLRSLLGAAP
jgi:hypothetical protein